jgi:predicted small secreted protein
MNRRIIALVLSAFLLAACAVGETVGTKVFHLGTSVYTVVIPKSFVEGEHTEAEALDDMVAYMQSPDTLLDFDVYHFAKAGYPDSLAAFVEKEAAEYGASEVVSDGSVNGIDVAWYRAVETWNGKAYDTLTYAMADGDDYVEIAFWLDGENAEAEAQAIIETLGFITR